MQQIWGYFINVRNTRVCYMKFDFVRIFTKCEILVRIMWRIGTNISRTVSTFGTKSSQCEIDEVWNLRPELITLFGRSVKIALILLQQKTVKLAAIFLQQKTVNLAATVKNGKVSSNFSAAKNGQVSSNFAAAKNGKVGSNFMAEKNGQVSTKYSAGREKRSS